MVSCSGNGLRVCGVHSTHKNEKRMFALAICFTPKTVLTGTFVCETIILEFCCVPSVPKFSNIIIGLACSDLMFLTLCVPFTAIDYASSIWLFPRWMCSMINYLQVRFFDFIRIWIYSSYKLWTYMAPMSSKRFTLVKVRIAKKLIPHTGLYLNAKLSAVRRLCVKMDESFLASGEN